MNEVMLWVEKYRPSKISECILTDDLKKTFQTFVDEGHIPNLLLSGGPGVGKTTVAKAMLNEIGATYMMINGSEESGTVAFATIFFIADIVFITEPFFTRRFWLMVEKFLRTSLVSLLSFISFSPLYHDYEVPLYHNGSLLASHFCSCHPFFHSVENTSKYSLCRILHHVHCP